MTFAVHHGSRFLLAAGGLQSEQAVRTTTRLRAVHDVYVLTYPRGSGHVPLTILARIETLLSNVPRSVGGHSPSIGNLALSDQCLAVNTRFRIRLWNTHDLEQSAAGMVTGNVLQHSGSLGSEVDDDDDDDGVDEAATATRQHRPGEILQISMSGPILAACINVRGIYVWDAPRRQRLRKIELPSRIHAGFHRNVIIQNSLYHFGFGLALHGTCLALTAAVKPGDWIEGLRQPQPRSCVTAHALVVVQEVGPAWLRTTTGL